MIIACPRISCTVRYATYLPPHDFYGYVSDLGAQLCMLQKAAQDLQENSNKYKWIIIYTQNINKQEDKLM